MTDETPPTPRFPVIPPTIAQIWQVRELLSRRLASIDDAEPEPRTAWEETNRIDREQLDALGVDPLPADWFLPVTERRDCLGTSIGGDLEFADHLDDAVGAPTVKVLVLGILGNLGPHTFPELRTRLQEKRPGVSDQSIRGALKYLERVGSIGVSGNPKSFLYQMVSHVEVPNVG
jgi:hypothetical protein